MHVIDKEIYWTGNGEWQKDSEVHVLATVPIVSWEDCLHEYTVDRQINAGRK